MPVRTPLGHCRLAGRCSARRRKRRKRWKVAGEAGSNTAAVDSSLAGGNGNTTPSGGASSNSGESQSQADSWAEVNERLASWLSKNGFSIRGLDGQAVDQLDFQQYLETKEAMDVDMQTAQPAKPQTPKEVASSARNSLETSNKAVHRSAAQVERLSKELVEFQKRAAEKRDAYTNALAQLAKLQDENEEAHLRLQEA